MSGQVKSKQRVADHGEVFTNEREVKAMVDLVWDNFGDGKKIGATYLEPACGSGNFLVEILERKLRLVLDFDKKEKSQNEFQKNIITALTSIYGVELLQDNAQECRQRLYDLTLKLYPKKYQQNNDFPKMQKSIEYILSQNIICGNALNYTTAQGDPIIFTHWAWVGEQIQRNFFDFGEITNVKDGMPSLFGEFITEEPPPLVDYLELFPLSPEGENTA